MKKSALFLSSAFLLAAVNMASISRAAEDPVTGLSGTPAVTCVTIRSLKDFTIEGPATDLLRMVSVPTSNTVTITPLADISKTLMVCLKAAGVNVSLDDDFSISYFHFVTDFRSPSPPADKLTLTLGTIPIKTREIITSNLPTHVTIRSLNDWTIKGPAKDLLHMVPVSASTSNTVTITPLADIPGTLSVFLMDSGVNVCVFNGEHSVSKFGFTLTFAPPFTTGKVPESPRPLERVKASEEGKVPGSSMESVLSKPHQTDHPGGA